MPCLLRRVLVVGIVNVTPDSFFPGARWPDRQAAIAAGLSLVADGADVLDVGGESSRPGAAPISAQEEMDRVLPVIRGLRAETESILSVDTTKAAVAREALAEGASMVNDISALRSEQEMTDVVASSGAVVVLMHMQGTPQTMQIAPRYHDVVEEVSRFLLDRAAAAEASGIASDRIVLDPGIGFGKTQQHNVDLLRRLSTLCSYGYPVMVGVSRKAFLGGTRGLPASDRLEATIAANTAAILRGASMIRVHDVKEAKRAAEMAVRLRI